MVSSDETIGLAWLEADGTLVLDLTTQDPRAGGLVQALFRYPKDHPKYDEILAHVGPIRVGERRAVRPWP